MGTKYLQSVSVLSALIPPSMASNTSMYSNYEDIRHNYGLLTVRSSEIQRRVVRCKSTDVSEEHIPYKIKVANKPTKKPELKQVES
jgi:predicted phage tail protein